MKKVISLIVAVLLCSVILAGCTCEHQWQEASCSAPKTCSLCGETQGEALPHTWQDATCTEPKTCRVCGATEGEKLNFFMSIWLAIVAFFKKLFGIK